MWQRHEQRRSATMQRKDFHLAILRDSDLLLLSLGNRRRYRNVKRAGMLRVVVQRHRNRVRVLRGFLGDNAATVVVLLAVQAVDRRDEQAQAAAGLHTPRDERETIELV